jgi:alpha-tubulin suppressor-like RCC1 family protein
MWVGRHTGERLDRPVAARRDDQRQLRTLGLGDTADRLTPTRAGAETDWSLISAGFEHSLALKADGSLWTWGTTGALLPILADSCRGGTVSAAASFFVCQKALPASANDPGSSP